MRRSYTTRSASILATAGYLDLYRRPGRDVVGVPHFGRVRYRELYPGIDLEFYGNPQQLEYDFVVAGRLEQQTPVIYQEVDGVNQRQSSKIPPTDSPATHGFRQALATPFL